MDFWHKWSELVKPLRGAFRRKRTFFWMVLVLLGFYLKNEFWGVTSLARGVGLKKKFYTRMLGLFESRAWDIRALVTCWTQVVLRHTGLLVEVNQRQVLVGDGLKFGKEGRKMPGVQWLHQSSTNNRKPRYIMGHALEALCILMRKGTSLFALPLNVGVHHPEAMQRSALETLFSLVKEVFQNQPLYLVVDRYYASGKLIKQLKTQQTDLIVKMKKKCGGVYPALPRSSEEDPGSPPGLWREAQAF